jgi:hypothetical protein
MGDWKYIICGYHEPAWDEFDGEHGSYELETVAQASVDRTDNEGAAKFVAEVVAEDQGLSDDVTICLEDPHGNRYEVDVHEEKVSAYTAGNCKLLGKPAP